MRYQTGLMTERPHSLRLLFSPAQSALILCLGILGACGDDDGRTNDAGTDATIDAPSAADAGDDGGMTTDAGRDAGTIMADGGMDAGTVLADAGTDAFDGPCIPFTATGCDEGSWCEPNEDPSTGTCIVAGDGEEGGACTETNECGVRMICVLSAPDAGTCESICNPNATPGTPTNTCEDGDRCANLRGAGGPLPVGICQPSCDYDAGTACRDSALSCAPAELVSSDHDLCLMAPDVPAGGDCDLATIPHLRLCAGDRICLDRPDFLPGNLCYQVCRESVGTLNATNHPDCAAPTQECRRFGVGLGACLPTP